jgi:hypothetical protein
MLYTRNTIDQLSINSSLANEIHGEDSDLAIIATKTFSNDSFECLICQAVYDLDGQKYLINCPMVTSLDPEYEYEAVTSKDSHGLGFTNLQFLSQQSPPQQFNYNVKCLDESKGVLKAIKIGIRLSEIFPGTDNYIIKYADIRGIAAPTHNLVNVGMNDLKIKFNKSIYDECIGNARLKDARGYKTTTSSSQSISSISLRVIDTHIFSVGKTFKSSFLILECAIDNVSLYKDCILTMPNGPDNTVGSVTNFSSCLGIYKDTFSITTGELRVGYINGVSVNDDIVSINTNLDAASSSNKTNFLQWFKEQISIANIGKGLNNFLNNLKTLEQAIPEWVKTAIEIYDAVKSIISILSFALALLSNETDDELEATHYFNNLLMYDTNLKANKITDNDNVIFEFNLRYVPSPHMTKITLYRHKMFVRSNDPVIYYILIKEYDMETKDVEVKRQLYQINESLGIWRVANFDYSYFMNIRKTVEILDPYYITTATMSDVMSWFSVMSPSRKDFVPMDEVFIRRVVENCVKSHLI